MTQKTVLEADRLCVAYDGDVRALSGVSLRVNRGEMLGIIGPSGCGKSTLCLCLSGIIPHSNPADMRGDVLLSGENTRDLTLPAIATSVGIVFQDPVTQLFLPRVRNELAFGPENLCRPVEEIREIVDEVAAVTGIADLLGRHPHQISGGQQQLAAVAAVLALGPDVLILDEAMSQLDESSAGKVLDVALAVRDSGRAVVMVEHNLARLRAADRVLALKDGRVLAEGTAGDMLADEALLEACYEMTADGAP